MNSIFSSSTQLGSNDNTDASGNSNKSNNKDASGNIDPSGNNTNNNGLFSFLNKKTNNKNKDASGNDTDSKTVNPTDQYLNYLIHIIMLIIILFIWGVLSSNLLSLVTCPKSVKNYFFPSEKYDEPYCASNKQAFYYRYSFPYTSVESVCETPEANAKRILSKAVYNDIFAASIEEGGIGIGPTLAKAAQEWFYNVNYYTYSNIRGFIKSAIEFPNVEPASNVGNKRGSVDTVNEMKEDKIRMFFILLGTPVFYYLFLFLIVSALTFLLTIASSAYNGGKIIWGLFWTFVTLFPFFIPIIMGVINAIYMLLTNINMFVLYPVTNNLKLNSAFKQFFQELQPFLLILFYLGSIYYALSDLDTIPAAGITIILLYYLIKMAFDAMNS